MSLHALWPDMARLSAARTYNLPDGGRVSIRPFQLEDRAAVAALLERLSPQSLYSRFHSASVRITDPILDLVTAGHALVAEVEGHVVALASWHPLPDGWQAELGIVVDDLHQRRGIGTTLCYALCQEAQGAGIRRLRAELLGSNHAMLRLLRGLGFQATYRAAHGVVEVAIELLRAAA